MGEEEIEVPPGSEQTPIANNLKKCIECGAMVPHLRRERCLKCYRAKFGFSMNAHRTKCSCGKYTYSKEGHHRKCPPVTTQAQAPIAAEDMAKVTTSDIAAVCEGVVARALITKASDCPYCHIPRDASRCAKNCRGSWYCTREKGHPGECVPCRAGSENVEDHNLSPRAP